mmetsp:Transcript_28150/g.56604  ORF Transcript_28150/g.56604 Transcript_28150/m.56604 type:complete len:250 (-) Transcript_28150:1185-1934(-)
MRTILLAYLAICITTTAAFAPPAFGLGALFRPPNIKIIKSDGSRLDEAGKFFVDAFWTGKVGGGADTLSPKQAFQLERQQVAEFSKRYRRRAAKQSGRLPGNYAGQSLDSSSELVLCVNGSDEVIGCAGVEVSRIKKMDGYDSSFSGPLMSNLAISRKYRRKGLAEDLVKAAENIARREWGYDDCYLYVEKRNTPAIKLYQKLGYKSIWEDDSATTLLPTGDGRIANGKTTIVCMKKRIGAGLFGNLFG